jgi:hypothetical protein
MNGKLLGATAVIVAAIVVAMKFHPQVLPLNPDIGKNFVSFFTQLAAIALFVERALEVLVTPWREKDAEKINVQATVAQQELTAHLDRAKSAADVPAAAQALAEKLPSLQQQVVTTGQDLADYRSDTQRIAFIGSLAVGIVVSLIGFRALDFFVAGGAGSALANYPLQLKLFQAIDVVLTGALISGGADGIHQIITIFTNFADQTKKKQDQS